MAETKSARVRRQLRHPVVDADGHWLELYPIFMDYLGEVAGAKAVDRYRDIVKGTPGYGGSNLVTPDMRIKQRIRRQSWWTQPTRARDRTAYMVPKLAYESLDEWGMDISLLYPTMGFVLLKIIRELDLRQQVVQAYNHMAADMFKPYQDRLIPAAIISLDTPAEALEQLEHARTLGHKLVVMNGTTERAVEASGANAVPTGRYYFDAFGMDSPYDYDPVWQKLVEMKVALTLHTGTMGWPDRSSPSSFVFNHLGHFSQSHHLTARALFMGGVTQRFPTLKVGFLEGGAGWACNLYGDLVGHWKKRNRRFMQEHFDPLLLDLEEVRRLMEKYTAGDARFARNLDNALSANLEPTEPDVSQQVLHDRNTDADDFHKVKIDSVEDIRRLFATNFYFGCEADDPMTTMAFNERAGLRLKALMGSDIGHFDVPDPTEVLSEAWEMVEHGLMTEDNFREFTFTNAVELHGGSNPDFFKGTPLEKVASDELDRATNRDFTTLRHAS